METIRKTRPIVGAAALAMAILTAGPASAIDSINLKVVGTWGYLNNWAKVEKPFWTEEIKEASGNRITSDASPMTDLGLKGFEVMRMLQLGLFDVAHGIISYLGDDPVAEGIDLAGVVQDWATAHEVVDAYRDILAERFDKTYNAKLLGIYPFHAQMMYCNAPIESIGSLDGLKIRSYSKSMSDMITGLGGSPVTIAYGEVVPALQLGTVDCAITGNFSAYSSGWYEVTTHLFELSSGYAFAFIAMSNNTWAKLDEETRAFIQKEVSENMEPRAWELIKAETAQGVACLTGTAKCEAGEPGDLVDVKLSDEDNAKRVTVLENSVLKSYAARCDGECVENWNRTIGKVTGLQISE